MKERFQNAASKASEKQEVVDKLERMAEGFLSLDQSSYDQDDAPGSVAVTDDKGVIAYAQARPFGGVLSFDYLNEKGSQVEEYSIEPDFMGTSYTMDVGGVTRSVYQNGNGLLALMEQIDLIAPDKPEDGDKPEEAK
jgi:hypothetical protein